MSEALTYDDMGVIQVTENRNFIERAKDWYNNLREDYKENYIDTGKAQEFEQKVEESSERLKEGIKNVGEIAGTIGGFLTESSAFGKLCSKVASPALAKLADIAANIQKKLLIGGKRFIEKHFLHVDGTNQEVTAYDFDNNIAEVIEDFGEAKDNFNEVREGWSR